MVELNIQNKLAEQLGNVSEASRISGVSCDTTYRHRRLIKEGGIKAL
jgi:transcriptional regulator of acetoin/glycerol metabolism